MPAAAEIADVSAVMSRFFAAVASTATETDCRVRPPGPDVTTWVCLSIEFVTSALVEL